MHIESIRDEVSTRTWGAIRNEGCETLDDIASKTTREWLCAPNFGKVSFNELRKVMQKYGYPTFGVARHTNNISDYVSGQLAGIEDDIQSIRWRLNKIEELIKSLDKVLKENGS